MTPLLATLFTLILSSAAGPPAERKPDKAVEVSVRDGKPTFAEKGTDKPGPVVAVVGQTVRWINLDSRPHHFVSIAEIDGKPVVDTGVIEPGGYRDLVLDGDLYRRAGGKMAGVVTVTFKSRGGKADPVGELKILSPAKSQPSRP